MYQGEQWMLLEQCKATAQGGGRDSEGQKQPDYSPAPLESQEPLQGAGVLGVQ